MAISGLVVTGDPCGAGTAGVHKAATEGASAGRGASAGAGAGVGNAPAATLGTGTSRCSPVMDGLSWAARCADSAMACACNRAVKSVMPRFGAMSAARFCAQAGDTQAENTPTVNTKVHTSCHVDLVGLIGWLSVMGCCPPRFAAGCQKKPAPLLATVGPFVAHAKSLAKKTCNSPGHATDHPS